MKVLKGKGIFGGIAFGVLRAFERDYFGINSEKIYTSDHNGEINRYKAARATAMKQLEALYKEALEEIGEEHAMIFQVHRMMLEDIEYTNSVTSIITNENANAEYAIWVTSRNFERSFETMDNDYMQQRASDVRDVSNRIINCLDEDSIKNEIECKKDVIIGADDLAPSEILELNRNMVKGLITILGSENSHTSILAKAMEIPTVIGLGEQLIADYEGCDVIVDSFAGAVYVLPDKTTVRRLKRKKELCKLRREMLSDLKGKEDVTLDGRKVELCANVGNIADLTSVLESDAKGVGLFRSEFVFMGRNDYPSEEEQFKIYKKISEKMADKNVVIRTLDIGADKYVRYFKLPRETNPAMGYRAIRICLDRPRLFKTQLRAILRASAFGRIELLFPMIVSLEEIVEIKKILNQTKAELDAEGIVYDKDIKIGVMIETPAAVMISDELAKEADFFNIGTNDLTQYSLAVDRQNDKINYLYNPRHKSILRMIKIVCDNAKKYGIKTCVCGEIAADESLTEVFLAMGVNKLSMSSPFILSIRKRVRELDISRCEKEIIEDLEF
jgi:phosphotransferase system enzyme I (PtsI)